MKKLTLAKIAGASAMLATLAPAVAHAAEYDYSTTDAATSTAGAGVAIVFLVIWLLAMAVGLFLFVFWIIMIIDVFKRTNWKQESDKTLWIILVIILGYLGAIIYYFAVKRPLDSKSPAPVASAPVEPQK